MDDRVDESPARQPLPDPGDVAEELDRERRFSALGSSLSTLRIFLMLAVQGYLLLGFSLIFVRPPSGAFYAAILALSANTLLFAGCLLRFFRIRRRMLRLSGLGRLSGPPAASHRPPDAG